MRIDYACSRKGYYKKGLYGKAGFDYNTMKLACFTRTLADKPRWTRMSQQAHGTLTMYFPYAIVRQYSLIKHLQQLCGCNYCKWDWRNSLVN